MTRSKTSTKSKTKTISKPEPGDVTEREQKADDLDTGAAGPTAEVGSEGGTPGDVEVEVDRHGAGSEAGETWRPRQRVRRVVRDETGRGRRSP
jgi:hypothetical protein